MSRRRSLRIALRLGLTVAALLGLTWTLSWLLKASPDFTPKVYPPEFLAELEASRRIPMARPEEAPRLPVDVDYAEGTAAAWWPQRESPILAPLALRAGETARDLEPRIADALAAGELDEATAATARKHPLPPVAERVGSEPLVLRGCEGTGTYGGTWLVGSKVDNLEYRQTACGLVRWSPQGFPIVPHVAKGWTVGVGADDQPDYKSYAFALRRGMRWSDGHPFTAEDLLYWWTYEANEPTLYGRYPEPLYSSGEKGWVEAREILPDGTRRWVRGFIGAEPGELRDAEIGGATVRALAIPFVDGVARPQQLTGHPPRLLDPYAIRFVFTKPHALFLHLMASARGLAINAAPAHYLRPLHPVIGDRERLDAEAAARDMEEVALYKYLKKAENPEHPRLWPWVYRTFKANPPHDAVRNPYFFAVDPEGRQLPYLDRIHFNPKEQKMGVMAVAGGHYSMGSGLAGGEEYSLIMAGAVPDPEDPPIYRVTHWYRADRTYETLQPNLNRRGEPDEDDPDEIAYIGCKRDLLADVRFRRALSLAINREEVIQAYYTGLTEACQVAPGRESFFFHERCFKAATAYDPGEANRLLDELGLTARDSEGMRMWRGPDGQPRRLTFFLNIYKYWAPIYFVTHYWRQVGVRVVPRIMAMGLYYAKKGGLQHDLCFFPGDNEHEPIIDPRTHVPTGPESNYAIGFGQWYKQGGLQGLLDGKELAPGVIEPPVDHPLRRAMELYDEIKVTGDRAEQKQLYDRIQDIAADNLWTISICSMAPLYVVVDKDIGNVPDVAVFTFDFISPGNSGYETYFHRDPGESPGTIAAVRQGIMTITPPPSSAAGEEAVAAGATWIGTAIGWLVLLGAIGLAVMIVIRHPFVGRRLAIMVPTLLAISVIVFAVIQLPEGDYVDARIVQLQMEGGGEVDEQEIVRLRQSFHLDEPVYQQYLRWMGFRWFETLHVIDRGEDGPPLSWRDFPWIEGDDSATGLIQGNLGRSMENDRKVNQLVGDRIWFTFLIALGSILFTWAVAIPLGIYSAVKQYSPGDYALTFLGFIGMCIPSFLFALLLMFFSREVFGVEISGLFSREYGAQPEWTWGKFVDLLKHLWVPVVVMGVTGTAGMIRVMRANLLDELKKPYVTTARAKGVRPLKLLFKYPVRLALNPFISGIGGIFPMLVSGGTIVAVVLSLPTVGPLLLKGVMQEDMYLAGSMLVILSLLAVVGTLVSDLLLLWLDPRIRFEGSAK